MGNKSNLLLTTIVESRHHAITLFLVSDGGGVGEGGGKGQVEKVYSFSTLKMVKKVLKAASF